MDVPMFSEPALCAETDPEVWFPEMGGDHGRKAKSVCTRCYAQAECLTWAIEHRESGIWGGTTERQRAKLRAA